MSQYDADDFKTLILRIDRGGRTAVSDFGEVLHYGDGLKVILKGVRGLDLPSAEVSMVAPVDGAYTVLTTGGEPGNVNQVPGDCDAAYVTLNLRTDGMKDLTEAVDAGTPVTVRLYLVDAVKTWVDQEIEVYPSPLLAGSATATPGDRFVTVGEMHDIAEALAAMPTLNAADREARFNRLIAMLGGLNV